MKRLFLIICFISTPLIAQVVEEISKTPLQADHFVGYDGYGNVYYELNMVLRKSGPLGEFEFRDYQLGPMSQIDIKNPLNVVVLYEESNVVVFLDNRLNEIERINFNEVDGFPLVSQVENAGNNRLWIFDINTQQLELYDYRNERLIPISQPIADEVLDLASDFNYCYVLTDNGVMKFNIYASFLSETDSDDFTKIIMQNQLVLGISDKGYSVASWPEDAVEQDFKPLKIPIPENTIKDLQLTQDFLYIYNGLDIHAFSITQPKQ